MDEMKGIERIKQLLKQLEESDNKEKKSIKKVAEYLINREDMNERLANEEKNLIDMWNYIREEARKEAVNNCAVLEDQDVYNLAVHYFDETNEALGINKTKKTTPKAETKKQEAKTEENASNTKQDAQVQQEEKKADVPAHKDDDIVMKYKGRAITYKEFKDGTYLQLS